MIRLQSVNFAYPGDGPHVLANVDLDIAQGEFVLVVGPSGAGKSTLLRCLNGLIPHFHGGHIGGHIAIADKDPVTLGPSAMSALVGFVFQNPESQFVTDTVESELAFAMENHGIPRETMKARIDETLHRLSLNALRGRRISTLSGGEKQRIAIAAVLTLRPKILVLDEPTSQLDPQGADDVLQLLRRLNRKEDLTVILSEHRLERVLPYVDRMIYLPEAGKPPLMGPPREILAQIPLVPPLVAVGRALGWDPLPLTVEEAQQRTLLETDAEAGDSEAPTEDAPEGRVEIEVAGLHHHYGNIPALCDVNLQLRRGECLAIMGPNGSGKTTLLKQMVGLLKPQRGTIMVRGRSTSQTPLDELIEIIGYVPQNPDTLLFADTVREELAFTRRNHGLDPHAGTDALLEQLSIRRYAQHYPRDLSVGERQRVALASVLAAAPEILLLDEPTRGVDPDQKLRLVSSLRAQKGRGHATVLSTHDVELAAQVADRVIVLKEGRVAMCGSTAAIMRQSETFASQLARLSNAAYLTAEEALCALS